LQLLLNRRTEAKPVYSGSTEKIIISKVLENVTYRCNNKFTMENNNKAIESAKEDSGKQFLSRKF